MNKFTRNLNLIECESFSLHVAPGEYHSFPLVDNKGLFAHFRKTNEDFKYSHEAFPTKRGVVIGVYKKVGCFAILVCAFSNLNEMNKETKDILAENPSMHDYIESTFRLLKTH